MSTKRQAFPQTQPQTHPLKQPWQPYPAAPFARSSPRRVYLVRRQWLSPQLIRIWLSGQSPGQPSSPNSLADFPGQSLGSHIKLLFKQPQQTDLTLPYWAEQGAVWPEPALRPISRTFTLAAWDKPTGQVAVDIAVHAHPGPAGLFAQHAPLHSPLGLAGPGGPVLANLAAQSWWLFADLTGLPLLRALLQVKPPQVHAQAFIELPAQGQTVPLPAFGASIHWCIRPPATQAPRSRTLLHQAEQLPALNAATSWVVLACEHQPWQALHQHWTHTRTLPAQNLYALPYWHEHQTEEGFHHQRHQVLDQIPPTHWHTNA